jgi:hypothetical protein
MRVFVDVQRDDFGGEDHDFARRGDGRGTGRHQQRSDRHRARKDCRKPLHLSSKREVPSS